MSRQIGIEELIPRTLCWFNKGTHMDKFITVSEDEYNQLLYYDRLFGEGQDFLEILQERYKLAQS